MGRVGWDMFCACPWNGCLVVHCYARQVILKVVRCGQSMECVKSMEALTSELARVSAIRLPDWPPQGPRSWLETASGVLAFGTFLLYSSSTYYFTVRFQFCILFLSKPMVLWGSNENQHTFLTRSMVVWTELWYHSLHNRFSVSVKQPRIFQTSRLVRRW